MSIRKKKKEPANKYNNKKTEVDGFKFDSQVEAKYYKHLKHLRDETNEVIDFKLQPKFELQAAFTKRGIKFRAIDYKADFEVWYSDGSYEVVDIKGQLLPEFKIKRKLFEKKFPYELKLISWSGIDGGWIEVDDLVAARKVRKKEKELKQLDK